MRRSGLLLGGLVALGTVALAGCSSAPGATSSAPTAVTGSTTTTAPDAGGGVETSAAQFIPPSVPNDAAARKDVLMPDCNATADGWSAGGVAKNPAKTAATFIITVFFVNPAATDLDYAQTTVTVPPEGAQFWLAEATFRAPRRVDCILRGVATA